MSDAGSRPFFWAMRRAMRNWRPVRPSSRMAARALATPPSSGRLMRGCSAGVAESSERPGAPAPAAAIWPPPPGVAVRLMRNRLALGFVVIEHFRFFQGVEHVQLTVHENAGLAGKPGQSFGLV